MKSSSLDNPMAVLLMSRVIEGDCVDVMAGMEPESVDAVVTDPPYGLEFMGKEWDGANGFRRALNANDAGRDDVFGRTSRTSPEYRTSPMRRRPELDAVNAGMSRQGGRQWRGEDGQKRQARDMRTYQEWSQRWAEAAYRVAKPSAYLLAFGGTRTVHRMTVALEDAGWIIRDMLVWAYASGFPKSKASLKPAWEPIVMARKPGPLRMLAIDECRIGPPLTEAEIARTGGVMGEPDGRGIYGPGKRRPAGAPRTTHKDGNRRTSHSTGVIDYAPPLGEYPAAAGRWPANVLLTDPIFDGGVEGVVGGGYQDSPASYVRNVRPERFDDTSISLPVPEMVNAYGDSGTYSRFFLIPKADRADREPLLPLLPGGSLRGAETRPDRPTNHPSRQNHHPTVKPTDLMRHLVRLVTPTGGLVLDPFLGSGTTAIACELEGFRWLGIEKEAEYVKIAEARLNGTQRGMGLAG